MKKTVKPAFEKSKFAKALPWILIACGIVGLIASAVLLYDGFRLAQNHNYRPSCNLDPIVSCGDVALSAQGTLLAHMPNPWIGLAAFVVPATLGVAMLAGGQFKRWLWVGLEAGTAGGILFIHWLFFESVYRIHALCPYCMAVWVATITMFWYVTVYNLDTGNLVIAGNKNHPITVFVRKHHLDILILWLLIIAALILKHFWYYYSKYL